MSTPTSAVAVDKPSLTLRLGLTSLVLCGVSGVLIYSAGHADPHLRHDFIAVALLHLPGLFGTGMALGTVGAAFGEDTFERKTVLGLLLAGIGGAMEWFLWHLQ